MAAARISATTNFRENKGESGHKDKGSHKSPSGFTKTKLGLVWLNLCIKDAAL